MGYAVELQDMQCRLAAGFPILAKRFYHIFKAAVVVAVGSCASRTTVMARPTVASSTVGLQ